MNKIVVIFTSCLLIIGWIWIFAQTDSLYVQAGMIVFGILGGGLITSHSDDEHDIDEDHEMFS